MKILHVIPSVGPARGGPSAAVVAMAQGLQGRGLDVSITTTNDNGAKTLEVPTSKWTLYQQVPSYFHARWPELPVALREFQWSPDYSCWLGGELPKYDIVHVHAIFSALPTLTMGLCRKVGVPYIARPLGQLDPWSLSQKPTKKKLYFNLFERGNLTNSAVLHCTSRTESENVRQIFPDANIQVIPHGVNSFLPVSAARHKLRKRFLLSEDSRVILFLSRWAPKKNIPFLLEVLGGIRQHNWTLILAGSADDGYEKVVLQSVKKHHLADRVICTGHVESEEKQLLLQGSDLFVLPSITENFGIAVAEALCAGLPCIVSQGVDLAPSLLGLAGGWVLPNNLEEWRSHITMALSIEEEKFSGLSERAMLEFSWSRCCERLHNLYNDIIGNSK